MAMKRWALAAAVGWFIAGSLHAEPLRIDRSIGKQPAYKITPQYALLAFGSGAKDRVWLVRDGDVLYVDRNGNGDLTDPGEKVLDAKSPGHDPEQEGYTFHVGDLSVGGRTHKGLTLASIPLKTLPALEHLPTVKAALAKDDKASAAMMTLDVQVPGMKGGGVEGRVTFFAGPVDLSGVLRFADNPAQAPVIHLGGPLQITFFNEAPSLRAGRSSDVVLVVGAPGVGPGTFAMLTYNDTIPESLRPTMEIRYQPGQPSAREIFEIKERC
jgi:hypothetical protein